MLNQQLKHFRLKHREGGITPHLLFEVQLEFPESASCSTGLFCAPGDSLDELEWSRDLVYPVDEASLGELEPRLFQWPVRAEEKMFHYLQRYYRATILRNYELNILSIPGEDKEQFVERCKSELEDERRAALSSVRDLFLRRFLEVERRCLDALMEDEWSRKEADRHNAELRNVFSEIRDRFSLCFLREDWNPLTTEDLGWSGRLDIERQERLEALRDEFIRRYNEVNGNFLEKAQKIEPYEAGLQQASISLEPRGVLWI